jgi:iduronate 2-sulfatase
MPWRFPSPWLSHLPPAAEIALAAHPTMDRSVPPIAHHTPDLQSQAGGDPFDAMNATLARLDRLFYYSSVAWMDSQVGRVIDELDTLGLTDSTLTVLHSDHGWALGEHGQWQKFNNCADCELNSGP